MIDALSTNQTARTVVELSLNPCFERGYSSLFKAVTGFVSVKSDQIDTDIVRERIKLERKILELQSEFLPSPEKRNFYLFAVDGTPQPRLESPTLADRSYVHQTTKISGNKPITIGHQYAIVGLLPEKIKPHDPAWCVPLSIRRIPTEQTEQRVGEKQLKDILDNDALPFNKELCVQVADSKYGNKNYLGKFVDYDNLITITRLKSNLVLYKQPADHQELSVARGHPQWYGRAFRLGDSETWGSPDEKTEHQWQSRKGKIYTVRIEKYSDLLMKGSKEISMHKHPQNIFRITVVDHNNKPLYKNALWLTATGKRRNELNCKDVYEAYTQRFDLEHFLRFGKQRLLLASFQTPDIEAEENWWSICGLAYFQLFLAKDLVKAHPHPWQKYLPPSPSGALTASEVQRGLSQLKGVFDEPAKSPKPRGKSDGRPKGTKLPKRPKYPIVKKKKKEKQLQKQA